MGSKKRRARLKRRRQYIDISKKKVVEEKVGWLDWIVSLIL